MMWIFAFIVFVVVGGLVITAYALVALIELVGLIILGIARIIDHYRNRNPQRT